MKPHCSSPPCIHSRVINTHDKMRVNAGPCHSTRKPSLSSSVSLTQLQKCTLMNYSIHIQEITIKHSVLELSAPPQQPDAHLLTVITTWSRLSMSAAVARHQCFVRILRATTAPPQATNNQRHCLITICLNILSQAEQGSRQEIFNITG